MLHYTLHVFFCNKFDKLHSKTECRLDGMQ
jgi:hypothetical protein